MWRGRAGSGAQETDGAAAARQRGDSTYLWHGRSECFLPSVSFAGFCPDSALSDRSRVPLSWPRPGEQLEHVEYPVGSLAVAFPYHLGIWLFFVCLLFFFFFKLVLASGELLYWQVSGACSLQLVKSSLAHPSRKENSAYNKLRLRSCSISLRQQRKHILLNLL